MLRNNVITVHCLPWLEQYLHSQNNVTLTLARTWKQSRCPLTDEWIKLWYRYTMEYYSAIRRNAFESVVMRLMNLEPIIRSEVSQKKKDKYCILTHILEKAMAPHSSTLAWKVPRTEEPCSLQSTGSQTVGHK